MDGRVRSGNGARTIAVSVAWEPQPWQAAFLSCPIEEVFGGGARGGPKTDAVLGDWLNHADQYKENAIGLMMRRSRTELLETHERARVIYDKLAGSRSTYSRCDSSCRAVRATDVFVSGSRLGPDVFQGASFTRCYVEECGNFPNPTPILKLMATLRSGVGVPGGDATDRQSRRCRASVGARPIHRPGSTRVESDQGSRNGIGDAFTCRRVSRRTKCLGEDYVRRLARRRHARTGPRVARVVGRSSPARSFRNGRVIATSSTPRALPGTGHGFVRSTGLGQAVRRALVGPFRMGLCRISRAVVWSATESGSA